MIGRTSDRRGSRPSHWPSTLATNTRLDPHTATLSPYKLNRVPVGQPSHHLNLASYYGPTTLTGTDQVQVSNPTKLGLNLDSPPDRQQQPSQLSHSLHPPPLPLSSRPDYSEPPSDQLVIDWLFGIDQSNGAWVLGQKRMSRPCLLKFRVSTKIRLQLITPPEQSQTAVTLVAVSDWLLTVSKS